MSAYCLDTSGYSNFRRGNKELAALLDRAEMVGVPTVALGELRTGFMLGGKRQRNEAEIVVDLRKAGTPVPTSDIWIAATAARHGASVLTCDEHFQLIGRVGSILVAV